MTTQAELCAQMLEVAGMIRQHSGKGALHIFIDDGNCQIEDLEWCMEQPGITAEEAAFVRWLIENVSEGAIFGAWALAQCTP